MRLRRLLRRIPAIAWRDQKIRQWQAKSRRLERQLATRAPRPRTRASPTASDPESGTASSSGARRWYSPKGERAVDMLRASGLFDEAFYLRQLANGQVPGPGPRDGAEPAGDDEVVPTDALDHYLQIGQKAGLLPHPAFLPDFYLRQLTKTQTRVALNRARRAALLHYLTVGAAEGRSPHPLFNAAAFLEQYPEAADHPGGALGRFLDPSLPELLAPTGEPPRPWGRRDELLRRSTAAAGALLASAGHLHLERDRPEMDTEAEDLLKARLRTQNPLPDPADVVSVVVPTKDRGAMLPAALDSVLAQTYPHWQLIVVDDGSTDDTADVLAEYAADSRVVVVTHDRAHGVAHARNSGLARATGRWIAYLDSDNTWHSDFLELMVRHLHASGDRVAYAMSALIEQGGEQRRLFRGMPFHREALLERNYIDCIVLIHERVLLEETGGFDESLRRNVDWDLFVRMAEVTDFGYVPFVATDYDVWEERTERITRDEPIAYRYLVRQRAMLNWERVRAGVAERDPELTSVVIAARFAGEALADTVQRIQTTARGPVEVIVVDASTRTHAFIRAHAVLADNAGVTLHRLSQPLPTEVCRNVGASLTTGRVICFLPEYAWTEPGWDLPLRAALKEHAVSQPVVLNTGGSVLSAGATFTTSGEPVLLWREFPGTAPELEQTRTVAAVTSLALATTAERFASAEGFDPLEVEHHLSTSLSLRLTRDGGTASCAPTSTLSVRVPLEQPTRPRAVLVAHENERRARAAWASVGQPVGEEQPFRGYRLTGYQHLTGSAGGAVPLLVHDRPERPLRWAIKIGASTVQRRYNWGDWHFALSLSDSLRRLGHEVVIDCARAWHRPTAHLDDVVLVLRGIREYRINPGHTNICWVISHPEMVGHAELAQYDLAFGASPSWSRKVAARTGQHVETLLQCTDHHRFRPVEPDPNRAHEVLAVANARGMRPSVGAALEAGIVPSVYGVRWAGLLPEGSWQGEYIANNELPHVYTAAGVVLNDHWDDMREQGLLSNRLFDLTACDARVISDHLPEVRAVFDDVVLTYRDSDDLPGLVRTHLGETPERAEARRELGRRVRAEHTFDARAAHLDDRVRQVRQGVAASGDVNQTA